MLSDVKRLSQSTDGLERKNSTENRKKKEKKKKEDRKDADIYLGALPISDQDNLNCLQDILLPASSVSICYRPSSESKRSRPVSSTT